MLKNYGIKNTSFTNRLTIKKQAKRQESRRNTLKAGKADPVAITLTIKDVEEIKQNLPRKFFRSRQPNRCLEIRFTFIQAFRNEE